MKRLALFLFLVLTTSSMFAQTPTNRSTDAANEQPVEVGLVHWGRDLDAAFKLSEKLDRPVLVLFQEVPGCAGCQKFGREVLSHPLIVEAIEDEFVPVVVYNNQASGRDAELLKRFKEPACNYQVVRFLNSDGKDIIKRQDGVWSTTGIASRMISALNAAKRRVPKYLQTVAASGDEANHAKAAFSMSCFWTGEYELGKIDGVVATEAGWLDGQEVTLVQYDKSQLTLSSLAKQAAEVRCANKVYTDDGKSQGRLPGGTLEGYRPASDSDQNKQISRLTALHSVPGLNEMQKTKINSLAPRNAEQALQWLSPRQRQFLANVGLH